MQNSNAATASLMGTEATVAGLQRIQWVPATSATSKAEGGSIAALGLQPINPPPAVWPSGPSPRPSARGLAYPDNDSTSLEDEEKMLHIVGGGAGVGAGLENLGNTCYLNSTLQCLTYSRPLTVLALKGRLRQASAQSALQEKNSRMPNSVENYSNRGLPGGFRGSPSTFLKIGSKVQGEGASKGEFCVLRAVEQHIVDATRAAPRSVTRPMNIVRHLRQICKHMRVGKQEDAHEFLRYLVEAMHEAAGGDSRKQQKKTIVTELFEGQLRSQIICQGCRKDSNTYEPCLDLSLDVARGKEVFRSLDAVLKGFCTAERLDGVNKYKCDSCKRLCSALKMFSLHKPPPLLVIHFKRFGFSLFSGGKKIDTKIDFPLTLDLTSYVTHSDFASGSVYNLYAVLVHAGSSTRSGHYYSFVRSIKPGSQDVWYSVDDERVRRVDVKTVLAQRAYILFYERQAARDGKRRNAITVKHAEMDLARLGQSKLPSLSMGSPCTQAAENRVAEQQANFLNGDEPTPRAQSPCKAGPRQRAATTVSRSCPRAFDNPHILKGLLTQCLRTRSYYLAGLRSLRRTRKPEAASLEASPLVNSQQVKYSERESIANQDRATQRTSLKDDWSFHQRNDKWEDVDFKLAARHDSLVMKERASNSRPKRDWWDADYDKGRQKKTKRNNKQHMRFQASTGQQGAALANPFDNFAVKKKPNQRLRLST